MEIRIGKRPNEDTFPIWAWYQYKNKDSRRPDLRTTGFLPKGTKGVRIEFEKPENEILLSDFNLWHFPLNYWNIADNEEKDLEFEKLLEKHNVKFIEIEKYPLEAKKIIVNSWNKIFDMNYECEYVTEKINEKKIQATFWKLNKTEIKKVDFFTAK